MLKPRAKAGQQLRYDIKPDKKLHQQRNISEYFDIPGADLGKDRAGQCSQHAHCGADHKGNQPAQD